MKLNMLAGLIVSVSLAATLGVAVPASARSAGPYACSSDALVAGSTEADGQITHLTGLGMGHCGYLRLRVNYTSVGGAFWTSWRSSAYSAGYVSLNVGNSATRSEHKTSIGALYFSSIR